MAGKRLLITSKIISKIMGMILVIACGIELFIGFIFALFMGPIETPQVDNLMMIGIAALTLLLQSIPYFMMITGTIGVIIGGINILISAIIDNYIDLDILDKKRKSYKLIILVCFYGILITPSLFLMIFAIIDAEDFFTTFYILSWIFIINIPNIVMFSFLLASRNIIRKYKLEKININNE
ncbi:MAG: hypothetical protein E7183_05050 [Erysipelotrichaceae bacterium]|nr:hypothetical protein [Erysipelotrichaceae bacterium]